MATLTIQQGDSATIAVILPSAKMAQVQDIVCTVGTLRYRLADGTLKETAEPNAFLVELSSSQTQTLPEFVELTVAVDYSDLGVRKTSSAENLKITVERNQNTFSNTAEGESIRATVIVSFANPVVTNGVLTIQQGDSATIALVLPADRMDEVEDIVCTVGPFRFRLADGTLATTATPNVFRIRLTSAQTQNIRFSQQVTVSIFYADLGVRKTTPLQNMVLVVQPNPNNFSNDSAATTVSGTITITIDETEIEASVVIAQLEAEIQAVIAELIKGDPGENATPEVIDWTDIQNKPTTFPPAAHTHAINDVTNLQTTLDGKAAVSHTHAITDVTNLQSTLDGKAATSHTHGISDVTGLQTALDAKANTSHGHTISDVSGLQTALDGKAATSHGHAIADVSGLQTALDGKAAVSHSHAISDVSGLQTALDGKANTAHTHAIADVTGLQTALDGKQNILTRTTATVIETDFYFASTFNTDELQSVAISSGAIAARAGTANHPGVVAFRDSTTANGGFRVMTDITALLLAGGERAIITFQVSTVRAGLTAYLGFFDTTSITAPTDCVCAVITANGTTATLQGRGRANNTATNTATTFAPVVNTWYTLIVNVNSTSLATFTIVNDSGTQLWTDTVTNIPTAAGRETGFGAAAYESTVDAAADLILVDYMRMEVNRVLVR